jgi:Na+-transporting NADH:ubiquinone oxidoreductase subunit C
MKEKLKTILFMIVVSAVFTGLVSGVYSITRPRIRANERLALNRAIINAYAPELLPAGASGEMVESVFEEYIRETGVTFSPPESKELPGASREEYSVYEGLDESGSVLAYIFEIRGRGLWGDIRGYLAVSPDLAEIAGISFYLHSETPGLGAEITKEWFLSAFEGRPIPDEPGDDGLYLAFSVPRDEDIPEDAPKVHAITGATGTTNSVEKMVNEDLGAFLKAMRDKAGKTSGSPEPEEST